MRTFRAAALGTYYASGAASAGPNAEALRDLVFLVKNNRIGGPLPATLNHPYHPSRTPIVLRNQAEACAYAAEIVVARASGILRALGLGHQKIALVPMPSSEVTRATLDTARFPSRALAEALEARAFGTMHVCVVNRHSTAADHSNEVRTPAHVLAANLEVIATPPRDHAVIYIDDVLRRGSHVAALDHVLARPDECAALMIGVTEGSQKIDSFTPHLRDVTYDPSAIPWMVSAKRRPSSPPPPPR